MESDGGRKTLKAMAQTPGIRVLASSRVSLERTFTTPFKIDHLDEESAYQLFIQSWAGDTGDLEEQDVKTFVMDELGGHALSIVLMAYLGDSYSWTSLLGKWQKKGTKFLKADGSSDRQDNLELSFDITREHLSKYKGALDLWQFIALFPDGVDSDTLDIWEALTGFDEVRQKLFKHNLIAKKDGKITMLPPVSRYALSDISIQKKHKDGFNWTNARTHFYSYFLKISEPIVDAKSSDTQVLAILQCSEQLWGLHRFLQTDQRSKPNKKQYEQACQKLYRLMYQMTNVYSRRVNASASYAVVSEIREQLSNALVMLNIGELETFLGKVEDSFISLKQAINLAKQEKNQSILANALQALGELENRLGNVEQTRAHYDKAIELYQKELNQLGLANALQSLGELESRLGEVKQARALYDKAIELYQKEQDHLGLANALQALGNLESRLGEVKQARAHYDKAIEFYQKERVKFGLANALQALGDLESRLGNVEQARAHYDKAIEFHKEEKHQLGLANALQSLGELESRLGKVEQARAHYDKAIELYQKDQVNIGLANALQALGDLESRLGNVEQAWAHYDKAIELYQKEQHQLGLACVYQLLGEVAKDNNQLFEAHDHYEQALFLSESEQDVLGQANICRLKGELCFLKSEYDLANSNYQKALDIYRNIKSQLGEAYVLKGQADILAKTGSESAAVMLYGKALRLYQKEQYPSGEAKTLIAMLQCEVKRDVLSRGELSDLAEQTWDAAQRSSLPSVIDKAREAIIGVLGEGFDFDKQGDALSEA